MKKNKKAFTMAEILISLTIIGIIAAITLPALRGNVNERVWETQKKALESRLSQSLALLPSLSGYGIGADNTETASKATLAFINEGLSKVLKLSGICDKDHMRDCGITDKYINLSGDSKNFPTKLSELNSGFMVNTGVTVNGVNAYYNGTNTPDTDVAAVKTKNGESMVVIYNPKCTDGLNEKYVYFPESRMCVDFIYDLNGKSGPNTVGKDIGVITALYSSDPEILAPVPHPQDIYAKKYNEAIAACGDIDDSLKLPDRDELAVMFFNRQLFGMIYNYYYWAMGPTVQIEDPNTGDPVDYGWASTFDYGRIYIEKATNQYTVRCVKQ